MHGNLLNEGDQERQRDGVFKEGEENDDSAEDKRSVMLKGKDNMKGRQKVKEGGDLERDKTSVREVNVMKLEEVDCGFKGEKRSFEDVEGGDLKEIEEKDDSIEGATRGYCAPSTRYTVRCSVTSASCEESLQSKDSDTGECVLVISSSSDFEGGSLLENKRKQVCVYKQNTPLYFPLTLIVVGI